MSESAKTEKKPRLDTSEGAKTEQKEEKNEWHYCKWCGAWVNKPDKWCYRRPKS